MPPLCAHSPASLAVQTPDTSATWGSWTSTSSRQNQRKLVGQCGDKMGASQVGRRVGGGGSTVSAQEQ